MEKLVITLAILLLIPDMLHAQNQPHEITFGGGVRLDIDNAVTRIIIPLYTEAFKRLGIEFNAVQLPERRSLAMSNSGKVDGELRRVENFHEVSNNKFPNLIRVEFNIYTTEWSVFALKSAPIVNSISDLKDKAVGYRRGTAWIEKNLGKGSAKVTLLNSDISAFRFVEMGRAEYVVISKDAGLQVLNNMKDLNLVYRGSVGEIKVYPYMHKKHKLLAIKFAEMLEEMRIDGTYKKISDQYLTR